MLIMRRDKDFGRAQTLLTSVLHRGYGGQTYIRRLRAVAAAAAGDMHVAREDVAFLMARGASGDLTSIEARIRLWQGDYDGAEAELTKGGALSAPGELLRARILDARAEDAATPFGDRERLRNEAAVIRARHRMTDEFEVER